MSYQSFEQVLQKCHTEEKEFWQVILEDDMAERDCSCRRVWNICVLPGMPCCLRQPLTKEI